MHVPGVKQELPDKKPGLTGPVEADMIVRDADNVRLVKMTKEDPSRVIQTLNSLMRKTKGGPIFVDTIVRDGGNTRIVKITGEKDTAKVIRVLNSLVRKVNAAERKNTPIDEDGETQLPEGDNCDDVMEATTA